MEEKIRTLQETLARTEKHISELGGTLQEMTKEYEAVKRDNDEKAIIVKLNRSFIEDLIALRKSRGKEAPINTVVQNTIRSQQALYIQEYRKKREKKAALKRHFHEL